MHLGGASVVWSEQLPTDEQPPIGGRPSFIVSMLAPKEYRLPRQRACCRQPLRPLQSLRCSQRGFVGGFRFGRLFGIRQRVRLAQQGAELCKARGSRRRNAWRCGLLGKRCRLA